EHLTLVERITRLNAKTLEYAVTMTDPTVWSAPWTTKQELTMQSDTENGIYYEPRCHEGNYGLPALLVGARLDEKKFKEGKGPDPAAQDTASCLLNPENPQSAARIPGGIMRRVVTTLSAAAASAAIATSVSCTSSQPSQQAG